MAEARRFVSTAPENSETPLDAIHGWVTPTRLFFVRNHFDVPSVDVDQWRLTVDGCVKQSLALTRDEISALPQRSLLVTMECAGNGRSFLQPAVPGVQWGAGAVAHAEWTGVPLRAVLERAAVQPQAVEVVFEGADRGTDPDHPEPMHFARSLPLAKAFRPDTLLVTHMNGEPLEPSHGYPLRLLVPGWYGVASVKWLTRIHVSDRPFEGYFQTNKYTVRRQGSAALEIVPVQGMAVKSQIVRPHSGETLGVGRQRLFGVAWAGEEAVGSVQVSTDRGASWRDAELLGPHAPYSWTFWEYDWNVAEPGRYDLLVRATSTGGRAQPLEHDPLNGGYQIHFCRPTEVQVTAASIEPQVRVDAAALLYDMNAFAERNVEMPLDVLLEFSLGGGI